MLCATQGFFQPFWVLTDIAVYFGLAKKRLAVSGLVYVSDEGGGGSGCDRCNGCDLM
jgi:hypothetical protein